MMKMIWLCCLLLAPFAGAAELVSKCKLNNSPAKQVEAVRDSPIADTHIFYLRQDGETRPFFERPDASRGSSVQIACAGRKHHALLVSGEFTANALQGFVLTYDADAGKVARLDFAEKSRPEWLYLGKHETLLVIPTHGYGDSDKKYVVYRHASGSTADPDPEATDRLPAKAGFEVLRFRNR